jgi:hypothetical protein
MRAAATAAARSLRQLRCGAVVARASEPVIAARMVVARNVALLSAPRLNGGRWWATSGVSVVPIQPLKCERRPTWPAFGVLLGVAVTLRGEAGFILAGGKLASTVSSF